MPKCKELASENTEVSQQASILFLGRRHLVRFRLLGDDQILDFVVGGLGNNFLVYEIELGAVGTGIDDFLRVGIADPGSALS